MSVNMRVLSKFAQMGLVFALGLIAYYAFKPPSDGGGILPWDKADHYFAFLGLTILSVAAFPKQPLSQIFIVLAILGGMIEVVQGLPFVRRDCDVWDWVAELVAMSGVFATIVAAKVRREAP
jgi:VanZ family protein